MKNILISFLMIFTVQAGAIKCTDIFKARTSVSIGKFVEQAVGVTIGMGMGTLVFSEPMEVMPFFIASTALFLGISLYASRGDGMKDGEFKPSNVLNSRAAKQVANDLIDLEYLIKKGLDVNAVDKKGNTLLHYAENIESAKLLVENGADPSIKNKEGKTALNYHADIGNQSESVVHYLYGGFKTKNDQSPAL